MHFWSLFPDTLYIKGLRREWSGTRLSDKNLKKVSETGLSVFMCRGARKKIYQDSSLNICSVKPTEYIVMVIYE